MEKITCRSSRSRHPFGQRLFPAILFLRVRIIFQAKFCYAKRIRTQNLKVKIFQNFQKERDKPYNCDT